MLLDFPKRRGRLMSFKMKIIGEKQLNRVNLKILEVNERSLKKDQFPLLQRIQSNYFLGKEPDEIILGFRLLRIF